MQQAGSRMGVSGRLRDGDALGPINDDDPLEVRELKGRLNVLKQEHQDLDASVAALMAKSLPDQIQIARLKKKKLWLRDQIVRIEDELTPDIIA